MPSVRRDRVMRSAVCLLCQVARYATAMDFALLAAVEVSQARYVGMVVVVVCAHSSWELGGVVAWLLAFV